MGAVSTKALHLLNTDDERRKADHLPLGSFNRHLVIGGADKVGNHKTLVPDSDKWGARFAEFVPLAALLER
jgi:hypothetical protein